MMPILYITFNSVMHTFFSFYLCKHCNNNYHVNPITYFIEEEEKEEDNAFKTTVPMMSAKETLPFLRS